MEFTSDFLYLMLYCYQNGKPDYTTLIRRDIAFMERVKTRLHGN